MSEVLTRRQEPIFRCRIEACQCCGREHDLPWYVHPRAREPREAREGQVPVWTVCPATGAPLTGWLETRPTAKKVRVDEQAIDRKLQRAYDSGRIDKENPNQVVDLN